MGQRRIRKLRSGDRDSYRDIVEGLIDIAYRVHMDSAGNATRIEFLNDGITRVLGYQPDEYSEDVRDWMTLVHPDDVPVIRDSERRMIESGRTSRTYRSRKKDGTYAWLEDRIQPVRAPDGAVIAYHGVARDITDTRRAEDALRRANERFELAFSAVNSAIYDWNLSDDAVVWSGGLTTVFGYDRDALQSKDEWWVSRVHPDDRSRVLKAFDDAIASAGDVVLEYRFMDAEGNYRQVLDRGKVVVSDGSPVRVVGSIVDISGLKLAEESLRQNEARLKAIVNSEPECVKVVSPDGILLEMNPAGLRMIAASKPEDAIGQSLEALLYPEDRNKFFRLHRAVLKGESGKLQFRMLDLTGKLHWMESSSVPLRDGAGSITAVLSVTREITAQKDAEALQSALFRIAERSSLATDIYDFYRSIHSIVGELMDARNFYIALLDKKSGLLEFPYFVDEYDPPPPAGIPLQRGLTELVLRTGQPELVSPERFQELVDKGEVNELGAPSLDWLGVPLKSGGATFGVLVVQTYTEKVRYGEREKDVLTFVSQHIAGALERKQAEETIRHQAYHDALTHLPNRMLFNDRFAQALARAHRNRELLAMLFLDLDRFKTINDTLGHAAGDRLLQEVAVRLGQNLREGDTVARHGGDEFMVMLTGLRKVEDVANVARKLLHSVRPPFHIDGHELHVTTSIGISLYPHDGENAETLVKNADIALYRAKDQGRNMYQHYAPEMNSRAFEQLAMENNLRHALGREEFVLHFQPMIEVSTGNVVGMEALVRWQRPDGILVSPADFIPLAEDMGLIMPIGEWVLRAACRQNKIWQANGLAGKTISVNLSARQLVLRDFTETVRQILEETGLNPNLLELELTESTLMHNVETAGYILRELKGMGVRVSIDDFGTGYSSLSYLRRFPIDALKIDQSFIRDCTEDPDDAAIVGAIVSMARSLKLKVIAEGVERVDQLEFLRSLRCDMAQGFYFSRPVPAQNFEKLLESTPGI